MAYTSMVYNYSLFPFEVAVRRGIEHRPRVLPTNTFAKVRINNVTAKEKAEKVWFANFFGIFVEDVPVFNTISLDYLRTLLRLPLLI